MRGDQLAQEWGIFRAFEASPNGLTIVTDLNLSPDWELNFGLGFGLTEATDRLIVKMILGRRF